MSRHNAVKRRYYREHGGFSPSEVQVSKKYFQMADEDNSGKLKVTELISVLDELFPEMCTSIGLRSQVVDFIRETEHNENGMLDFYGFLALMRKCHDLQIGAKFDKEKRAQEETNFTQSEIQDFRELFLAADINNDSELSYQEFRNMIGQICPM